MNMMTSLGRPRLQGMLAAGIEVLRIQESLAAKRGNLVAELLRGQGEFYEQEHYPAGDVFDPESGAQYYYHAHRGDAREHGHFHVFMRPHHLPERFEPARRAKPGIAVEGAGPRGDAALAHIIAIGMDNYGLPVRLFTVNRWVTDESWFAARDVNLWLTSLMRLFQPEIAELIRRRDAAVEARARANPRADALEDRSLEITAALDISVERRVRQLRRSLS
jgi:hypothetical protein